MVKPKLKILMKNVEIILWRNTKTIMVNNQPMIKDFPNVRLNKLYKDASGQKKVAQGFDIEDLPLLIAGLQEVYKKESLHIYDEQGKPLDLFE